jgi:hypothetical protein
MRQEIAGNETALTLLGRGISRERVQHHAYARGPAWIAKLREKPAEHTRKHVADAGRRHSRIPVTAH